MGQRVEVHREDALDGGPAADTVTFTLDGKNHDIDLSNANAQMLGGALHPYAPAGRKATPGSGTRGTGACSSSSDPDTAKFRAWAMVNSYEVSDRGRIHQSVMDAYYAAR